MMKLTLRKWLAAAALSACLPLVPHTAFAVTAPAASLPDFADLVEKVGPAVVNIRTTANVPTNSGPRGMLPPGFDNGDMSEFFRRFFGIPLPQAPGNGGGKRQQPEERAGAGQSARHRAEPWRGLGLHRVGRRLRDDQCATSSTMRTPST